MEHITSRQNHVLQTLSLLFIALNLRWLPRVCDEYLSFTCLVSMQYNVHKDLLVVLLGLHLEALLSQC